MDTTFLNHRHIRRGSGNKLNSANGTDEKDEITGSLIHTCTCHIPFSSSPPPYTMTMHAIQASIVIKR